MIKDLSDSAGFGTPSFFSPAELPSIEGMFKKGPGDSRPPKTAQSLPEFDALSLHGMPSRFTLFLVLVSVLGVDAALNQTYSAHGGISTRCPLGS